MPHSDANQLIRYVFRGIPWVIELVWNGRDAPAPGAIMMLDGNFGERFGIIPTSDGYVPVCGAREFVDATEESANVEAAELAVLYWSEGEPDGSQGLNRSVKSMHESLEDLHGVLLQGLLEEARLGAPALVTIEEETPSGGRDGQDRDLPRRADESDWDPGF